MTERAPGASRIQPTRHPCFLVEVLAGRTRFTRPSEMHENYDWGLSISGGVAIPVNSMLALQFRFGYSEGRRSDSSELGLPEIVQGIIWHEYEGLNARTFSGAIGLRLSERAGRLGAHLVGLAGLYEYGNTDGAVVLSGGFTGQSHREAMSGDSRLYLGGTLGIGFDLWLSERAAITLESGYVTIATDEARGILPILAGVTIGW